MDPLEIVPECGTLVKRMSRGYTRIQKRLVLTNIHFLLLTGSWLYYISQPLLQLDGIM